MAAKILFPLIVVLCALVLSCDSPLLLEQVAPIVDSVRYETIDATGDQTLATLLSRVKIARRSAHANGGDSVLLHNAVKVTNLYRGITRYSLLLGNTSESSFENLVIRQRGDSVYAYVIHYQPDVDWLSNSTEFDMRTFRGTLTVLTTERELIQQLAFSNGIGMDITDQYVAGRLPCSGSAGSGGAGGGGTINPKPKNNLGGGLPGGGSTVPNNGSGGGGHGGGGSSGCTWSTSSTTGGLIIECPEFHRPLFMLRTPCAPKTFDDRNTDDKHEDPVGVLAPKKLTALRVNLDPSFSNNPTVLCIYNRIGGTQAFRDAISAFSDESSVLTLTFKLTRDLRDPRGKKLYGVTRSSEGFREMSIEIDSAYARTGNHLSIAGTMLHEALHAKINSWLHTIGGYENLNEGNFPDLFDAYVMAKNTRSPAQAVQHQVFAEKFIDIIAEALRQLDTGNMDNDMITIDHYRALAWIGLDQTIAYRSLSDSKKAKLEIDKVIMLGYSTFKCD